MGTSSPTRSLHVSATGIASVALFESDGALAVASFQDSATVVVPQVGADGDALFFQTDGNERARVSSNGNFGIGTPTPDPAARLEVTATDAGFLPPRLTTNERNLISSPPNGLILYNTTTNKLQVRAAGSWVDLH